MYSIFTVLFGVVWGYEGHVVQDPQLLQENGLFSIRYCILPLLHHDQPVSEQFPEEVTSNLVHVSLLNGLLFDTSPKEILGAKLSHLWQRIWVLLTLDITRESCVYDHAETQGNAAWVIAVGGEVVSLSSVHHLGPPELYDLLSIKNPLYTSEPVPPEGQYHLASADPVNIAIDIKKIQIFFMCNICKYIYPLILHHIYEKIAKTSIANVDNYFVPQ